MSGGNLRFMELRWVALGWLLSVRLAAAADTPCTPPSCSNSCNVPPVIVITTPDLHGGLPEQAADGDPVSHLRPASPDRTSLSIDFGCVRQVRRFRRLMTRNGDLATGASGNRGDRGERIDVAAGLFSTALEPETSRGWEAFAFSDFPQSFPHWQGLPYGWTPWLEPRQPLAARQVRFSWDAGRDALHEVALEFLAPGGTGPDLMAILSAPSCWGSPDCGVAQILHLQARNQDETRSARGVEHRFVVPEHTRVSSPGPCAGKPAGSVCTLRESEPLPPSSGFPEVLELEVLPETPPAVDLFLLVAVSDDGAQGADPVPANNVAAAIVPWARDTCRTLDSDCCVLRQLAARTVSTPGASQLRQGAALGGLRRLVQQIFETPQDLFLFYRLRDSVFVRTSGGRRASELYYQHDPEIRRLVMGDAGLRDEALDTLTAWRPVAQALVDGRSVTVTAGQADALANFLDSLRTAASPQLREALDRESAAIGVDSLAGLTVAKALARLDRLSCAPSGTAACLAGGRFRVEASWETPQGGRGAAHALPLTGDTTVFWFFDPANVEAIVKVVDGCAVGGRKWVFAAGLTDVRVVLSVTDTATGTVKTYVNPQGRAFRPVQDTAAFATCP